MNQMSQQTLKRVPQNGIFLMVKWDFLALGENAAFKLTEGIDGKEREGYS